MAERKNQKLKFTDAEALKTQIQDYFDELIDEEDPKNSRPPTMSGLAVHLGTTRKTLCDYIRDAQEGRGKRGDGEAQACGLLLIMAKARIEAYMEERLITNYTRGLEFVLSNGFEGWANKNTVTVDAQVEASHKADVKVSGVNLSDAELTERLKVLRARADEIMAREEGNA